MNLSVSKQSMLRSTSIIGGATVVAILLGILRMKVAALALGTQGVGFIGLFQNVILFAATIAGLGISSVAPRQIASERESNGERAEAALVCLLIVVSVILGFIGTAVWWIFGEAIATQLVGVPSLARSSGYLAIATLCTVISSTQVGVLTGIGRIRDASLVTVGGNLIATTLFGFALVGWPTFAIPTLLVSLPGAMTLIGFVLLRDRLRLSSEILRTSLRLHETLMLGVTVMVTGMITLAGQLAVRRIMLDSGGANDLGLFQAAWAIGNLYLMLALQAMSADFFPRLSASSKAEDRVVLINEQTEIALLLAAPCIVGLMGFATIALHVLYGGLFVTAAPMLQWQMLGDVLKIASWPLGYALLARNRKASYFLCELLSNAIFVGLSWVAVGRFGIAAPGIAYFAMYIVYLGAVLIAVRLDSPFSWSAIVRRDLGILGAAAIVVFAAVSINLRLGIALSLLGVVWALARALPTMKGMLAPQST